MSNRTGGTGCGWGLGIVALIMAIGSLYISGAVGVASLSPGADYGALLEALDLGGVLVIVALVALGMAKRERR